MAISSPQRKFKASIISHLFSLRRKTPIAAEMDCPPPPPPKDFKVSFNTNPQQTATKPLPIPQHEYITEKQALGFFDYSIPAAEPTLLLASSPPRNPPRVPLKGRVEISPRVTLTPEERAKRRLSAQRRREREEQEALREEQERQALRRRQKAEQERREREDEARRKAVVQEQLRQAAARKEKEERDAKACEERRLREIRERKQMEHERRLQYTRELEKWRHDQIQRAVSESSEKEEGRRRSAEERRIRIARLNEEVLQDGTSVALCGWVTIQTPDSMAWKRRYFKFDLPRAQMSLFRNHLDMARAMDVVNLDGRVDSFNEWYEGYEELEAIPHSFAVGFVDGQNWLVYADSADEKDKLLVLLSEAAGVIL
ncbi:hypothetical protein HYDPIDRAFT_29282 [Hydnomerulius pinastri MD-312]|uniref:PH domain-containing protein n=1 Tax=Hydnomerulius pinastri MD-312 TaxID=994086 RepID=A0A0C9VD12_9AGAM|nr:hypothetical protein HYDPIDRAFT_29282 [Hydnomerulius pinastri MD-312]